ncbi:LADA_0G13916g1_1 [Lachancea dasiensis]|uniref:LADA_0G13916g1_1 n=1 Tax=Lachancea dasiensis TaxID=1072105 RepID=A0A1G4JVU5_9SACH|nr:LADA_0G13916g1_1 [Lachancea dasiensis]
MTQDVSLIEPAKVRTLVVPVGEWTRSRFMEKVGELQERFEARLVDITPLEDPNFNPQGFPQGRLLFDFHTTLSNEEQAFFLHDFELYRKTFVLIGLVNKELRAPQEALELLQKKFPDSISHNLVYFEDLPVDDSKNIHCAFNSSLETIICDIGRNFLEALGLYYASYKHVTLRSPGAMGGASISKTALMRQPQLTTTSSSSSRILSNSLDTNTGSSLKRSTSFKSLGLNSGSSDQMKAKARQYKIFGNFKLLAGRYMDAMQNFAEAASTLHKFHDHIWLGSALEGLAISMLLLTYLRVPFQVPPFVSAICPLKEFEANSSQTGSAPRSSMASASVQSPRNSMSSISSKIAVIESQNVALPLLIKCISEKVLHYYEVSLSHNTEFAPQIVYCEHILRVARFMSYCHSHSELEKDLLKNGANYQPVASELNLGGSSLKNYFSKWEICHYTNRLFELQLKQMDLGSQIKVYTSLALIYRDLNFERKQAFISRILLVSLLPRHASESLLIHGDLHNNKVECLLEAYGVNRSPEKSIDDAARCSWVILQKNVLMLAINMASKAKDGQKVCEYSLLLLQKYSHALTQHEQKTILQNNILAFSATTKDIAYWDPFVLRKLYIVQLENHKVVPQKKLISNGKDQEITQHNSQVFNPFRNYGVRDTASKPKSATAASSFLLGETAEMVLGFQNPFKFDLIVTHLSFEECDKQYVDFLSSSVRRELPFTVKPNSLASIHLPVSFSKEVSTKHVIQRLNIGVFGLEPTPFNIVTAERMRNESSEESGRGKYGTFEFRVIREQPDLEFVGSTFNDNCQMMLEGTKETFKIVLRNQSLSQSANYLHFSHTTNIETNLSVDYWKKLPPDDLYDVEKQLIWLKQDCLKICDIPDEIAANSSIELTVDLDITQAPFDFKNFDIIIEYGFRPAHDDHFAFTKTLTIPFNITLKRSLEVSSLEVIPLPEPFPAGDNSILHASDTEKLNFNKGALLLLDIRNSWDESATVRLCCDKFSSNPQTLTAQSTKRFVVPIEKLDASFSWSSKEIPKLVGGRQFVSSGMTRDQVVAMRRNFWCREILLQFLKCEWKFHDVRATHGEVCFRQHLDKVDARTVDILCQQRDAPYHVQISSPQATIRMGETLKLTACVTANTHHPKYAEGMVQLDFLLYNRHTGLALPKSNTRLLYNGQLSHLVDPTTGIAVNLDILPIDTGEFEVGCCVDETHFNDEPVYFRVERSH